MHLSLRLKVLMVLAGGVSALVVFGPRPADEVVAVAGHGGEGSRTGGATVRRGSGPSVASPSTSMSKDAEALQRLQHRVAEAPQGSTLFAAHSWYVAPPPPPAPPPAPVNLTPPAPTAPPLPFAFLGRYLAGGTAVYYVTRGDRVYDIKAGDTIDASYRFDGAQGNQLVFTYQPLSVQQMLPIDSK